MKKIYFATWNKQKIHRMQSLAKKIANDFVIEPVPELIHVEENWATPMENAEQKIAPYENLDFPIIAWDTGLYFEWIQFNPTHVKRVALANAWLEAEQCSQEEIYSVLLNYYRDLADSHWWEFPFYYSDGWALKSTDGSIKIFQSKRNNILTNISHGEKQLYFPMCNLYKSSISWKYYTDRNESDMMCELQWQIAILEDIYKSL